MNHRRRFIRSKPKCRRVLWRNGRVIEDSSGMAKLRSAAFARANGRCECQLADSDRACSARVNWLDGQLHHVISRARGGSDVLENVAFVARQCHRELTGILQWTPVLPEWNAEGRA